MNSNVVYASLEAENSTNTISLRLKNRIWKNSHRSPIEKYWSNNFKMLSPSSSLARSKSIPGAPQKFRQQFLSFRPRHSRIDNLNSSELILSICDSICPSAQSILKSIPRTLSRANGYTHGNKTLAYSFKKKASTGKRIITSCRRISWREEHHHSRPMLVIANILL